jgi:hypothetical protein
MPSCLDAETLVAYCEDEIDSADVTRAEEHLHHCGACAAEVQRLVALRVAMAPSWAAIVPQTLARETPACAPAGDSTGREPAILRRRLGSSEGAFSSVWSRIRWFGARVFQPWSMAGALAASALLLITIAQLRGPESGDFQLRGDQIVRVTIVRDGVAARARPGDREPIVELLPRGTVAVSLKESAGWMRLRLADGRRVWVRRKDTDVARPD